MFSDRKDQSQDAASAPVVRVTAGSSPTVTVRYEEGLTVSDYLTFAEKSVRDGQVVTLNGDPAGMDDVVPADSVIVIASQTANG